MAADFEAEVRNGMKSLTASVDMLVKSQERATTATREYGKEAAAAFRSASTAAAGASKEKERLAKEMGQLGKSNEGLGKGLIDLGARFGVMGGVAVAAIGGIAAAMGGLNDKMDEARAKMAELGRGEGASLMDLASSTAQLGEHVDQDRILEAAQGAQGPVSQQQINAFVRSMASSGAKLNTAQVVAAIEDFASVGFVAGDGSALIEDLKKTGNTSRSASALRRRQDTLGQSRTEIRVREGERQGEVEENLFGSTTGQIESARIEGREQRKLRWQERLASEGRFSRAGVTALSEWAGEKVGAVPILGGLGRAIRGASRDEEDAKFNPLLRELIDVQKQQTRIMEEQGRQARPYGAEQ
jgi:hypothetical protein